MDVTPELIDSISKAIIGVIVAIGGIISTVAGYFTWKTRYELDKLYAAKYRPKPDGSPGEMRQHPKVMVKLFSRKPDAKKDGATIEPHS